MIIIIEKHAITSRAIKRTTPNTIATDWLVEDALSEVGEMVLFVWDEDALSAVGEIVLFVWDEVVLFVWVEVVLFVWVEVVIAWVEVVIFVEDDDCVMTDGRLLCVVEEMWVKESVMCEGGSVSEGVWCVEEEVWVRVSVICGGGSVSEGDMWRKCVMCGEESVCV